MIDDSGLTKDSLVTLKEYLEDKIEALAARITLTFQMEREALEKADAKLEQRLAATNGFKDAVKGQAMQFFTRREYEIQHQRVLDDISLIRVEVAKCITRAEAELIHTKIEEDTQRILQSLARAEGKASMTAVYAAYAFAALGILIGILDFIHG